MTVGAKVQQEASALILQVRFAVYFVVVHLQRCFGRLSV
jgi:hypothetical protein